MALKKKLQINILKDFNKDVTNRRTYLMKLLKSKSATFKRAIDAVHRSIPDRLGTKTGGYKYRWYRLKDGSWACNHCMLHKK